MKLVDVYDGQVQILMATTLLWKLLQERPLEHGISHKKLPEFHEHAKFVLSRPFRYWYLIRMDRDDDQNPVNEGVFVGAIECLETNEFGIHLFKAVQGVGLGRKAVELFLSTHEPLPAIPAIRNGHWLANVSPANEGAIAFFQALGFHKIQETLQLD